MYFVIRVTSGQEKIIADVLQRKLLKLPLPVFSLLVVPGMRGYIIVEAEDEVACREFIRDEPHVRGMLPSPLSNTELDKMLVVKEKVEQISVNDTVEFLSGPFKGYKAKVKKVDSYKDEITVELMDVAVSIPVTTKANIARIIEKAEKA